MANPNTQLEWCIVRLQEDLNWWVEEISDEVHWDVDGLGIIDPRQISHIIDLCDPLREYGFDPDIIDPAFITFRIDKELKDGRVRLIRVRDSVLDSDETLFALPDIMDEEKGPYADFLDQITKTRVKMINDLIDFEHNLTIDELEEEIRERQNNDFIEGRATHFFTEITAILEYAPEGFELDEEDDEEKSGDLDDIPDFEEENIEEDETMRWDEDEEDDFDENDDEDSDENSDEENDEEEEENVKPRRGRPRKS